MGFQEKCQAIKLKFQKWPLFMNNPTTNVAIKKLANWLMYWEMRAKDIIKINYDVKTIKKNIDAIIASLFSLSIFDWFEPGVCALAHSLMQFLHCSWSKLKLFGKIDTKVFPGIFLKFLLKRFDKVCNFDWSFWRGTGKGEDVWFWWDGLIFLLIFHSNFNLGRISNKEWEILQDFDLNNW